MGTPVISDDEMMAATRRLNVEGSFRVVEVARHGAGMRVVLTVEGSAERFAVDLPLPSTSALKPWLTVRPADAEQAAGDLAIWLMEETDTGCADWAERREEGEVTLLFMEPYGLRTQDRARHEELLKATTPPRGHGWWGWIQENSDETRKLPWRPV